MTLHELSDELLEIRRYVRSHPEHVRDRLVRHATYEGVPRITVDRLVTNLFTGLARIVVDPEILEGYLYGAAAEIREMAIEQENAG